jgi:hypothetical protein
MTTYSGADYGVGPGGLRPNSDAAAAAFAAAAGSLGPVSLVDFENLPLGYNQTFEAAPGIHIALTDLDGADTDCGVVAGADVTKGYNTTLGVGKGGQFLGVVPFFGIGTTEVGFTFDSPIQAWGAYLTGVGTANGNLHVSFNDGSSQDLAVVGSPDGGVQFFGFILAGNAISSVQLLQNGVVGNTRDMYGVDDIRVVSVPEPATLAVLALGGVGMLARRRRA